MLSVRVLLHSYRPGVFIGRKNITHVAAIVTWIIVARCWNFFLVSVLINKSLLAWAPVGSPRVCDCRNAVLSIFVYFDSLAVGTWSRNIILNIGIDWFY